MVDVYVVDVFYTGEYIDDVWCSVVQIYGRRSTGESVCIRIRGFNSYFYCLAPSHWLPAADAASAIVTPLKNVLRQRALEMVAIAASLDRGGECDKAGYQRKRSEQLESISVQAEAVRRTPTMYHHEECDVIRVSCSHPSAVAPMRDEIVRGNLYVSVVLPQDPSKYQSIQMPESVYEANLEYVLRFMVDNEVRCGAWIRVNGAFEDNVDSGCSSPDLVCYSALQIVAYSDAEEKERGFVPILTLLAFDIECGADKGKFPDPKIDPVIQIGCDITLLDGRSDAEIEADARGVFFALLETDAPSVGPDVDVRWFHNEPSLLIAFSKFVRFECDPDVFTSWNGPNFDWKYIVDRCTFLKCDASGATKFSRIPYYKTRNREITKSTKAYGTTKDNEVQIPGRVVFDMLLPIRKNYKLRSYKLDFVAEKFLDERKDDIKPSEITEMWRGTPETRGKLAHYCMQDSKLPRRLLLNRQMWTQYVEIARVCRVPINFLTTKGEQIKVFTQLCYKARQRGFVVDFIPQIESTNEEEDEIGYEGATVLEPVRGFYNRPIATLDFASLYPSIMRAHNLCYSTYVLPENVGEYAEEDIEITPTGDAFVRPHVRMGLLPEILEDLQAARTEAKDLMYAAEAAGDMVNHGVYDKRQQALKISANSVYGFTGVKKGKLPLQAIARSVTAYGREMIELTKAKVEECGPPGTEVVYGDTDSVMIKYPCSIPRGKDGKLEDVEAAIAESREYALEGAKAVNAIFLKPIKLEYEKVFYPFLLISKKRYAGGFFDKPAPVRKYLATKGIESQRRDNAMMIPRILDEVLTCMMDDLSPERAVKAAVDSVRAIVNGPVEPDDIITQCAQNAYDAADTASSDKNNAAGSVPGLPISVAADIKSALTLVHIEGLRRGKTPHTLKKEWCEATREVVERWSGADAAVEAVETTLRQNVTLGDHVISKAYGRPIEEYKDILPHIEVLKNMAERSLKGDVIAANYRKYLGDRIDYIIIAPVPGERNDVSEATDEVVTTDSKGNLLPNSLERLRGAIPVLKTEIVVKDGVKIEVTRTALCKIKKTKRTADRAEDPEWATFKDYVPDALYYIENQLINPCARLLKPFLGGKEEAVQRILGNMARISRPRRGFCISRFDSDTLDMLNIKKKRRASPVAQDKLDQKKWDRQHKNNPNPPKRPKNTGPMDAFCLVKKP